MQELSEIDECLVEGTEPITLAISRLTADTLDAPVRGQWIVEPTFQPSLAERTFSTPFIIVHTERQGCSYVTPEQLATVRRTPLVGRSVGECLDLAQWARVAVVDAVYGAYREDERAEVVSLDGTVTDKARARAGLVVAEVSAYLGTVEGARIALVGYSGEIAFQLNESGAQVKAYDLDPQIVGYANDSLEGPVAHGDALDVEDDFTLVVASGMTLVTQTFTSIRDGCQAQGLGLVMYCQTGSNLGEVLVECGAASVVAEHLPFYNWEGSSSISVHRR